MAMVCTLHESTKMILYQMLLTFKEHEIFQHMHELCHLTEDEYFMVRCLQLRKNSVQQLKLSRGSIQERPINTSASK